MEQHWRRGAQLHAQHGPVAFVTATTEEEEGEGAKTRPSAATATTKTQKIRTTQPSIQIQEATNNAVAQSERTETPHIQRDWQKKKNSKKKIKQNKK
ncbi:hypothetical protein TRSC58_07689 [Trypanosoma rangeli SC58]|uniref:Uncharacterized protein n=1 Tax=Trypanosoma rangeli SC58 TaxID=429131 RepID=A0A061ISE0_TRYRA|nr:hypothetical protein TRSC58_07689 [Trypanosoma rangeli SC58]